jgi:stringent starvation protein B
VQAVLALYAQENGQGMMFPAEEGDTPPPAPGPEDAGPGPSGEGPDKPKRSPHLRVVK